MKPKVLALTGCTASGKSGLAEAGREYPVEIVCMDSMQIYRRMDIGTAKPHAGQEQKLVPHHMLDILEPEESYAVARYVEDAERVFADIWQRGKLPLLVGGTGLYLKSLLHGMTLGQQESDPAVRARYEAIAAERTERQSSTPCWKRWMKRPPVGFTPTICGGWCGRWRFTS